MTTRESQMVVVKREDDGRPVIWSDKELADILAFLNENGVKTLASCSGHGYLPPTICLSDGRCIIVAKDVEDMNRMIALYGVDINGNPTPAADALIERLKGLLPVDGRPAGGTYEGGVKDAIDTLRQHFTDSKGLIDQNTEQDEIDAFLIKLGRPHLHTAFRGDGNPTDDEVCKEIGKSILQIRLGLASHVEDEARDTPVIDPRPIIRKHVGHCVGAESLRPYLRTTVPVSGEPPASAGNKGEE